jgi:hypothetical protein
MYKPALKIYGLFVALIISVMGLAQKTDKVFLKNGDVITGEIKSMKFAKMKFDMTGPGTIDIKWEEIVKINSVKIFQITMRKGDVVITTLDSLFLKTHDATLDDIVEIVRIQDKFLQRVDGDINLGFNYAKSSDNSQFNFSSSITYRKPKTEITLKINSVLTHNSKDTIVSKKQDAGIDFYKKLNKSFYWNTLFGWQQNTQLGLKNRFLINGSGGKILINDNQQRLLTGAGLSFNLEKTIDTATYKKNLEGLVLIQFKKFRYSTPKISIDAQYIIYPGISDWGRIRMDFQLNTKIEVFKDFNVGLSFYDLFDNRPAAAAASKNDFGINFTLGYEFGK